MRFNKYRENLYISIFQILFELVLLNKFTYNDVLELNNDENKLKKATSKKYKI